MAIKAVVLAQKNGDGADVALPRTSADLVGYEKENSTATNVREALDEMNDNFQGEAPGIVRRVLKPQRNSCNVERRAASHTLAAAAASAEPSVSDVTLACPMRVNARLMMSI